MAAIVYYSVIFRIGNEIIPMVFLATLNQDSIHNHAYLQSLVTRQWIQVWYLILTLPWVWTVFTMDFLQHQEWCHPQPQPHHHPHQDNPMDILLKPQIPMDITMIPTCHYQPQVEMTWELIGETLNMLIGELLNFAFALNYVTASFLYKSSSLLSCK